MNANELRAARLRMFLTQADLAALLDVSRQTVSYYETEHLRVPRAVELAMEALLYRKTNDPFARTRVDASKGGQELSSESVKA
jgi:DNA-binding XRE family transcriptional regulator